MIQISPSLFNVQGDELVEAIKAAEDADFFHIDVAHPDFVQTADQKPSLFWNENELRHVKAATNIPLDVHLMVPDPIDHVSRYAQFTPEFITYHHEATSDHVRTAKSIKEHGIKPGIALNPATPVSVLEDIIEHVDLVLLMSVVPGKGGQGYIHNTTQKVRELKQMIARKGLATKIEVDGGIKLYNARPPAYAGADMLVSGTGIFKHDLYSPSEVIRSMQRTLDQPTPALAIASDHGGYELKETLKQELTANGIHYADLGCHDTTSVDYPNFANKVAEQVQSGTYRKGVLICGTGIGIGIRANKYHDIRAAVAHDPYTGEMAARHNKANILCLGARTTSPETALATFGAWYHTGFEARHQKRVDMLEERGRLPV